MSKNNQTPEIVECTEETCYNKQDVVLSPAFMLCLKVGIMKDLHKKQLLTQKQMEQAINKLRKRGRA